MEVPIIAAIKAPEIRVRSGGGAGMFDDFTSSYEILERSGIENPLFEALRLFDLLSGGVIRNAGLGNLSGPDIDLPQVIRKRKEGIPWEYILGIAHFMGRLFVCTKDTLIPTDETRVLVKAALDSIHVQEERGEVPLVMELGTGCGNIACTLAMETQRARILASDISADAVAVAEMNVGRYKLANRISLFCGDLFAPFHELGYEGAVDYVICNPPYIPTGSLERLDREILDNEPRVALDGGPYGIDIFRRLIADSVTMLKPEGKLFFEIGERQEKLATRLLENSGGYKEIEYFTHEETIRALRAVKRQ